MGEPGSTTCGGCAGLDLETPARIENPPGQVAIGYRVGTHASFKESLLARLSRPDLPALAGLTSRQDGDFSIALCDALATALDVLTFYQERIANECLLRTATEQRSILELARLIGYQLAPGVAASAWLAFSLQESPGDPALAAAPVQIPVGTRVQSVPGPGEQAQSFETTVEVQARTEWNVIPVQTTVPWQPQVGDRALWLAGLGTGVVPGDAILIVGQERIDDSTSLRWKVRLLSEVTEDRAAQRTRIGWQAGLGDDNPPPAVGAAVYVLRQRAALFGHNAPDPRLIFDAVNHPAPTGMLNNAGTDWAGFEIQGQEIDLDAAYPKILPEGWIVLASNETVGHASGLSGPLGLFRVQSLAFPSRRDFGLAGKITRMVPDTDEAALDPFRNRLRGTLVLAQSEPLAVAPTPLGYPLYGDTLALGRLAPGIAPGQALALSGRSARIRLRLGVPPATLALNEGGSVQIREGDSLRLIGTPQTQVNGAWSPLAPAAFGARLASGSNAPLLLDVLDRDGREGSLELTAAAIELVPAQTEDEVVQEIAFVADLPGAVTQDRDRSTFTLSADLRHCYDRETATVNANVAPASHGETVSEVLGSGDARVPNARLALRQAPLTFVAAATPSGRQSTLQLRVNDLLWQETTSLYGHGSTERVYALSIDDLARTTLRFGDGVEGARLPSGDHNVRALYRKGLGLAGNVAAGRLTTLLSRPLGVTGAANPEAASGGEDPETQDRARTNAPLTVRTLDRAVSIRDYRDFARAFAGIAKAHALWIPSGPARGVFVSVAGEAGAAVPESGDTYRNLLAALRLYGDPLVPLRLASFRAATFGLSLLVKAADDADPDLVLPAIESALRSAFGFDARDFGQGVTVDEVSAVAQGVAGVTAVHVVALHRSDAPAPPLVPRIFADLPVASLVELPLASELLTLDPAPLVLDLMP